MTPLWNSIPVCQEKTRGVAMTETPATMSHIPIPRGYRRVRLLRRIEYARQSWGVDAQLVIDDTTGMQWEAAGLAVRVEDPPPGPQLWPSCPRCGAVFAIPAELPPGSGHWVQCPSCPGGWYR
jgi:predicted Zn finger-like uncharacterized protein